MTSTDALNVVGDGAARNLRVPGSSGFLTLGSYGGTITNSVFAGIEVAAAVDPDPAHSVWALYYHPNSSLPGGFVNNTIVASGPFGAEGTAVYANPGSTTPFVNNLVAGNRV